MLLVVAVFLLHSVQLVVCSQDKVLVGLYAESLCGDCVAFSSGPMNEAYNKVYMSRMVFAYMVNYTYPHEAKVGSIFTLRYVPWGNAQIAKNGSFECQHGKMECVVNTIEACAIYYYPNQ